MYLVPIIIVIKNRLKEKGKHHMGGNQFGLSVIGTTEAV